MTTAPLVIAEGSRVRLRVLNAAAGDEPAEADRVW